MSNYPTMPPADNNYMAITYPVKPGNTRPVNPDTNGKAITAIILMGVGIVFLVTMPFAIIFGHLALFEIKRDKKRGKGMAIAAMIVGYFYTIVFALAMMGF